MTFMEHPPDAVAVRTADVLRYVGLERPFWNSLVQRQLYTDLPPVRRGRAGRLFSADDVIAIEILAELLRIGVTPGIAARLAGELRAALRADPAAETLYMITAPDGQGGTQSAIIKQPPPEATVLWVIRVAKARADFHREFSNEGEN